MRHQSWYIGRMFHRPSTAYFVCFLLLNQPAAFDQSPHSAERDELIATNLKAKPLSHARIVDEADLAFVGTVTDSVLSFERIKTGSQMLICIVTIKVEQILFDENAQLKARELYSVRTADIESMAVKPGEKVLWFITIDSERDLAECVGDNSGRFRFLESGDVINLDDNKDLMDPIQVRAEIEELAKALPKGANRLRFRATLIEWAERVEHNPTGSVSGAVPYELMLARARVLHKKKMQKRNQ